MSLEKREKYKVKFTLRFDKDFTKVPNHIKNRVIEKVEELKDDPYKNKRLHGKFEGLFSMRIGDYRIIYIINKMEKIVILLSIAHRKKAYRI